jgi:ADP-heptose:LPS heptosyltransferase
VDRPQRILVVRLSHLGDVVQTLPLFHALRARFPEARIGWAVEMRFEGILDGLSGLDARLCFDRSGGVRAFAAGLRAVRAFGADLAIDAQANWKSAAVLCASGARRRVGPAPADWRERPAHLLANEHAAPLEGRERHAQARVFALARHVCGSFEVRRDPASTPAELDRGRAVFGALVAKGRSAVVFQVGPAGDVRTPPDALLVDSAAALAERGHAVVLTSAPREAERTRTLARRLSERGADVATRCEPESLRSFAAWLSAAAERGAVFVSADSGPLHVASAVGLACVCLSGPFDWRLTGPWPLANAADSPHRALVAQPPLDCAPCARRTCHRSGGRVCLEALTSDAVSRAVHDCARR